MRILVIDDPRSRKDLLRASQQWAKAISASIKIISVIDESVVRDTTRAIGAIGKITSAVKGDFIRETEEKIDSVLKNIGLLSLGGIEVTIGNTPEELKRVLDSYNPDLIVMSTVIKSGVINITAEIIGYSKGNCFVVTNAFKGLVFDRIILSIDDSNRDSLVIKTALMFAKEFNGMLYIMTVVESNEEMQMHASNLIEKMYIKANEMVKNTIKEAEKRQIRVEGIVKEGSTGDIITNFSRNVKPDIIIMGSHSRTGLNRIFMGSVAGRLIKRVGCPVLIVKRNFVLQKEKLFDKGILKT